MTEIKEPWRPKDGPGPRGAPDCYYRSRVLNSTQRYVDFVRALRREECRRATGDVAAAVFRKDNEMNEFCMRTDRKNCINKVKRKVELCMESYEDDLNKKRQRLREQLTMEEALHVRMMVEKAQAGMEAITAERLETLNGLLEKRRNEAIAISLGDFKFSRDELRTQRTIETKAINQYQIREKQAIKMQEMELEKMWKEVSMKEDEAQTMRMEFDTQDRYRRDMECKQYSDLMVQRKRELREAEEREMKEESLRVLEKMKQEESNALQAEAARQAAIRNSNKLRVAEAMREREAAVMARQKLNEDTRLAFDSLHEQALPGIQRHMECRKRQQKEIVECNKRLLETARLRNEDDAQMEQVNNKMAAEIQRAADERRCQYERWRIGLNKAAHEGRMIQIREHQLIDNDDQRGRDEKEYQQMHHDHLCRMDELQSEHDAYKRKEYQKSLLQQIKERELCREAQEKANKELHIKYPGIPWGLERTDGWEHDRHGFSRRMRAGREAASAAAVAPPCVCGPYK